MLVGFVACGDGDVDGDVDAGLGLGLELELEIYKELPRILDMVFEDWALWS